MRRVVLLLLGADQLTEPAHPGDPLVAEVPGQRQVATGPQHPGDLRKRTVEVPPVEGLRAHHRVDRPRSHRDPLRDGERGGGGRDPADQQPEHRVERVGGQHAVPETDQLLGQLAGAGAELEHLGVGRSRRARRRPRGVRRAGAVVGGRHPAEGQRGDGTFAAGLRGPSIAVRLPTTLALSCTPE